MVSEGISDIDVSYNNSKQSSVNLLCNTAGTKPTQSYFKHIKNEKTAQKKYQQQNGWEAWRAMTVTNVTQRAMTVTNVTQRAMTVTNVTQRAMTVTNVTQRAMAVTNVTHEMFLF